MGNQKEREMIDLILACFVAGVFFGGFWCGQKFGSLKAMFQAAVEAVGGK